MRSANDVDPTAKTVFEEVGHIINSEYGKITYEKWCKNEIKRIKNPKLYVKYDINTRGKKVCCVATE